MTSTSSFLLSQNKKTKNGAEMGSALVVEWYIQECERKVSCIREVLAS